MAEPKISAGVAFDRDVLQFLEQVCQDLHLDRSYVINAIVREYAKKRGTLKVERIIKI
jgi:hypothetical protein